jgi:hypothetical protein
MSLVTREDSIESEENIDLENQEIKQNYKAPEKSLWEKIKTIVIILVVL